MTPVTPVSRSRPELVIRAMATSPKGGQVAAFVMQTNAHSVLVIPTEIGGGRQVEVRRHLRECRVGLLALSGSAVARHADRPAVGGVSGAVPYRALPVVPVVGDADRQVDRADGSSGSTCATARPPPGDRPSPRSTSGPTHSVPQRWPEAEGAAGDGGCAEWSLSPTCEWPRSAGPVARTQNANTNAVVNRQRSPQTHRDVDVVSRMESRRSRCDC